MVFGHSGEGGRERWTREQTGDTLICYLSVVSNNNSSSCGSEFLLQYRLPASGPWMIGARPSKILQIGGKEPFKLRIPSIANGGTDHVDRVPRSTRRVIHFVQCSFVPSLSHSPDMP